MRPNTAEFPPPQIWWAIWSAASLSFYILVGIFHFSGLGSYELGPLAPFFALPFLATSALIRFFLLHRVRQGQKFALFVAGLALADFGGLVSMLASSFLQVPLTSAAILLMLLHAPPLIRKK